MSVRNNAATLALALRSLQMQTFTDWELILIDDGSTDASADVARRVGDPRILVIRERESRGLAARLNQAIDLARGELLTRFDGDDVCFPERFARQVTYLDTPPEVDLLGTGAVVFEGDGRALGLRWTPSSHEAICARPWSGFYLAHPTWMGRTSWFRRYRYDERALKSEDYDLLLRTHSESRLAALPEPLLGYREERLMRAKNCAYRLHVMAAQWRHAQRTAQWRALPGAWLGQLAKAAVDALVIGTPIERRVLRHRAIPIDADSLAQWTEFWQVLTSGGSNGALHTG